MFDLRARGIDDYEGLRGPLATGAYGGVLFLKEKYQKNFKSKPSLCRRVMEAAKHELALPTPEASPVQPVAEQPPELSRRSRRTEGLSDKYFPHGIL